MSAHIESEIKMTTERSLDYEELVKATLNMIRRKEIKFDVEHYEYMDLYYDDVEKQISKGGSSIRLRSHVGYGYEMTIKRLMLKEGGLFSREEMNKKPDPMDLNGSLIEFVRSVFPKYEFDIVPVLKVETTRNEAFLEESDYTICIDGCRFFEPSSGIRSDLFYEVEFESIGSNSLDDPLISRIREMLAQRFSFVPSPSSKYVRGLEWVRSIDD